MQPMTFEGNNLTKYNEFLIECSKKDYFDQKTHSHHILPKFMHGTNDDENLLILSIQDHFTAHYILAHCFEFGSDNYCGNMYAANRLRINIDVPESFNKEFINHKNFTFKGHIHTEEAKKKISKSKKGIPRERWIIEAANASRRGKPISEKHKERIRECRKIAIEAGTYNHFTGDPNSTGRIEYRKKLSERGKTQQNGKDNHSAKKIQHVESGRIFDCFKDAMIEFGFKNYNKIRSEIKNGNFIILGEYSSTEKMKENSGKAKKLIHVETGQIFRSLSETIRKMKISSFPVLYGLIKKGVFRYVNNSPKFNSIPTKKVLHIQSGFQMDSVTETMNLFGLNHYYFTKLRKSGEFEFI